MLSSNTESSTVIVLFPRRNAAPPSSAPFPLKVDESTAILACPKRLSPPPRLKFPMLQSAMLDTKLLANTASTRVSFEFGDGREGGHGGVRGTSVSESGRPAGRERSLGACCKGALERSIVVDEGLRTTCAPHHVFFSLNLAARGHVPALSYIPGQHTHLRPTPKYHGQRENIRREHYNTPNTSRLHTTETGDMHGSSIHARYDN